MIFRLVHTCRSGIHHSWDTSTSYRRILFLILGTCVDPCIKRIDPRNQEALKNHPHHPSRFDPCSYLPLHRLARIDLVSGKPACLAQGREIVSWLTSRYTVGLYPFWNLSRDLQPNCRVALGQWSPKSFKGGSMVQPWNHCLIRGILILSNHNGWQSLFFLVALFCSDPTVSGPLSFSLSNDRPTSQVTIRARVIRSKLSVLQILEHAARLGRKFQVWSSQTRLLGIPFRTSRESVERFILMLVEMGIHDAGTASPLPLEATSKKRNNNKLK